MRTDDKTQSFKTTVTWKEVKERFIHVVETATWKMKGDTFNNKRFSTEHARRWGRDEKNRGGWSGASSSETVKYLRDGFHSDDFQVMDIEGPTRRHRRPAWGEDSGEVSLSRLTGGYDDYYLERADKEGRPGLTIECEFGFSCGVDATTIQKYGAWIASLISALEGRGYDLTVTINFTVSHLFLNHFKQGGYGQAPKKESVRILVKRPNEVSDFATWSALFSPAGYRHLIFCAVGVAADNIKSEVSGSLGHCIRSTWDVKLSEGTIVVTGDNASGRGFDPSDTLTAAAKREGII